MKLYELMTDINPQMSDTQTKALFNIFMAGNDPAQGIAAMKGNDYLLTACEQLVQQGKLVASNGGIAITNSGIAALQSAGIIDQNKKPTDLAAKLASPTD